MTRHDQQFINTLGVTALRPEDLGWTHFSTKREWKDAVEMYFSPGGVVPQAGSVAAREGNQQMQVIHDLERLYSGTTARRAEFRLPVRVGRMLPHGIGGARLPLGGAQWNLLAGTGRTGRQAERLG